MWVSKNSRFSANLKTTSPTPIASCFTMTLSILSSPFSQDTKRSSQTHFVVLLKPQAAIIYFCCQGNGVAIGHDDSYDYV